jgi:hypothetical protein
MNADWNGTKLYIFISRSKFVFAIVAVPWECIYCIIHVYLTSDDNELVHIRSGNCVYTYKKNVYKTD